MGLVEENQPGKVVRPRVGNITAVTLLDWGAGVIQGTQTVWQERAHS